MAYAMFLAVAAGVFIPYGAAAGVVINEIAWMGSLPQAGETATQAANNEWMEFANDGGVAVDLTGWRLEAADGTPSIALAGSIPAGGFFLLERTDDGSVPGVTADLIYTGALSNSGETLVLKGAGGMVVHTIDASGGWPAGDNTTKDTMQWSGTGWVSASPPPRAANAGNVPPPPTPPPAAEPAPAPPPPQASAGRAPTPSLGADAGPDVVAAAGTIVQFRGNAFGFDGEALDRARFLWNFGDGALAEGRSLTHTYHFPGTYRANLTVSSGSHAGSAWRRVSVVSPLVSIVEVKPGPDGFVELSNAGTADVDLSGLTLLDDRSALFRIPPGTLALAGGVLVLANATTKLDPLSWLALRDARGTALDNAQFPGTLPAGASWERTSDRFAVQLVPTPGVLNERAASRIAERAASSTPPPSVAVAAPPPVVPPETALKPASATFSPPSSMPLAAAAAGVPRHFFLVASAILGLLAAVGIVWLKRMVP